MSKPWPRANRDPDPSRLDPARETSPTAGLRPKKNGVRRCTGVGIRSSRVATRGGSGGSFQDGILRKMFSGWHFQGGVPSSGGCWSGVLGAGFLGFALQARVLRLVLLGSCCWARVVTPVVLGWCCYSKGGSVHRKRYEASGRSRQATGTTPPPGLRTAARGRPAQSPQRPALDLPSPVALALRREVDKGGDHRKAEGDEADVETLFFEAKAAMSQSPPGGQHGEPKGCHPAQKPIARQSLASVS